MVTWVPMLTLLTIWLGNEDEIYLTTLPYLVLIPIITAVKPWVLVDFFFETERFSDIVEY